MNPAFLALGLTDTRKHQHCPFQDHDDADPSFRAHGDRWVCTCGHGDLIDAYQRYFGVDFVRARDMVAGSISAPYSPVAARLNPVPEPSKTSDYALQLWNDADREDSYVRQHPYAVKKGITHAFAAGRTLVTGSVVGKQADCIVVPIREHGVGEVVAVQAINGDGAKQTFGALADAYLLTGDENDPSATWYAAEGWASGYALRSLDRHSVVIVSFGLGRLHKVAKLAAERYSPNRIVIVEDAK